MSFRINDIRFRCRRAIAKTWDVACRPINRDFSPNLAHWAKGQGFSPDEREAYLGESVSRVPVGVLALTGAKPPNKLERRGSDGFVLSCAAARELCQAVQLARSQPRPL